MTQTDSDIALAVILAGCSVNESNAMRVILSNSIQSRFYAIRH
jgi:hypothetical protein